MCSYTKAIFTDLTGRKIVPWSGENLKCVPNYPYNSIKKSIRDIYLIGWVAIQYHLIVDKSVQHLGKSEQKSPMASDNGWLPIR